MSRKQIEDAVINKLLCDMIFCFECDTSEKLATLEQIAVIDTNILSNYLED